MISILEEQVTRNVEVRVDFLRIGEIDNLNEKFTAEIRLLAKWSEIQDINMIQYDPKAHWNPRLYVQNLISDQPKVNVKHQIERMDEYVQVTETKTIKGQFWERFELYDVPFDLQQLNIVIKTRLKPEVITLIADVENYNLIHPETKRTFVGQQKWRLFNIIRLSYSLDSSQTRDAQSIWSTGTKVRSLTSNGEDEQSTIRYYKINEKKPPKVVATCFVARRSGFYVTNAFFLIFVFTLSALTVFSISKSAPESRLPTTYTLMLSSISFKWIFNRSLPSVPYLTMLDKYSIFGIVFINLLAAWHAIIGIYYKQLDDSMDFLILLTFILIFLVGHLFFLSIYFIITRKKRFLQSEECKFIKKFLRENHLNSLKQIEEEDIY